jgi:DNA invertase Pin-like site-specific DNA recombinase
MAKAKAEEKKDAIDELSALERRRIVSLSEAARLRGISVDTLRRQIQRTGKPQIIQLSPRRVGVRLGEALDA